MGELLYVTNTSVDGYIEDAAGGFNWTDPSDEVFAAITDLVRPVGTYLYGRRLYETMSVWETDPTLGTGSPLRVDFADVWKAADKVVWSSTLSEPSTERTRIEQRFDVDDVRSIKESATSDLMIGGATITAPVLDAGLVDECHLFMSPFVLGRGKPAFLGDALVRFELVDVRRFDIGTLHLHYRVKR